MSAVNPIQTGLADQRRWSRWPRRWVARINYEVHLVQLGARAFALRRPWTGTPVAAVGLTLVWLLWWPLYGLCLLLWLMASFGDATIGKLRRPPS